MYYKREGAALLLLTLSILNLVYATWRVKMRATADFEGYTYSAHDFPETMPLPVAQLPQVPIVAEESVHYPILGYESDAEWFSLTPGDAGYMRLGPDDRLFIVSMVHQLHCLRVINLGFTKAKISSPGHLQHCLNYLRQAALCSADLSLEPGNFEEKDFETERTGATHACRDWSLVYRLIDENFAKWNSTSAG